MGILYIDRVPVLLYNGYKRREVSMNEIVNIIVNNGVAVGIIAYFIYRDNKFMNSLTTTLTTLQTSVNSMKELLERIYEKEDENEKGS